MSIRAVKDKRPSRSVCVCWGVGVCVSVCVCLDSPVCRSGRQRKRLKVKPTADRPVQGQRAQTNLISDGCLSDCPRTVTPMKLRYLHGSRWTLTLKQVRSLHERNKYAKPM